MLLVSYSSTHKGIKLWGKFNGLASVFRPPHLLNTNSDCCDLPSEVCVIFNLVCKTLFGQIKADE